MARTLTLLLFLLPLFCCPRATDAQNPFFMPRDNTEPAVSRPSLRSTLLIKISLLQEQLREKAAGLIRQVKTGESPRALWIALLVAVAYGAVHAAGPGHGKSLAMCFILSRSPSLAGGLVFGTAIAFCHALSGAACVLGLHYVLQRSLSNGMADAAHTTQIVSFGLIALLGMVIFTKSSHALMSQHKSKIVPPAQECANPNGSLALWAMAVGLVPCPGVMMVMLFCLSMNVLVLGLILAGCIALGMAVTISVFVTAVVAGKAGFLNLISPGSAAAFEIFTGIFSGAAVSVFGAVFLWAALQGA